MSAKSDNLAQQDALWRAYVNADPDLHLLEHRKQAIAHRRIRKAYAKKARAEARRAILQSLINLAIGISIVATVAVLCCILVLLS